MKRKFLLLGTMLLTSASSVQSSYAQWVMYPGSSEAVSTATGKPDMGIGTKYYHPEDHPQQADTYPHWEPIFANGRQVGRIDQHGEVYNESGDSVGLIDPKDGTIIYNGRRAGHVDANGDIHGEHGDIVASSGSNGNVIINGRQAGRVDSQGSVYDSSGSAIGQVPAGNNAAGALMLLQNQNK
ncbi:hypothetical protein PT277_06445 [Acetobacteraceae bacterium ESL0709]|nr:hypothetical protein [Acetobacteraceae bacterium ESL0697]MDF7678336.1 hypothetical protein [Acetobacteraceae bacterium ESL0709]